MPMEKDWKDYVTEDVTLIFDLDSFAYKAASMFEDEVMSVIHKKSGKEVFKEKDSPVMKSVCTNPASLDPDYDGTNKPRYVKKPTGETENIKFKNKKDFWGLTKKKPSGWLGDLNDETDATGKIREGYEFLGNERLDFGDFEINITKVPKGEISLVVHNLKAQIQRIKDYLEIQQAKYVISSGENHRHELPLPVNPNKPDEPEAGRYKGNRAETERPVYLKELRDYIVKVMGAKDYTEARLEADDVINFYAWKSHIHYKTTGKHKYIVVCIDKDNYCFNGMYFNYYVAAGKTQWKHPYPYIVDGMGEIYIEKGKLKGDGLLFCMGMLLVSDPSDNWMVTRHAGIKYGPKDAIKLLSPCKTPKEAIKAVYDQYHEWFPNGTQYTSWNGKEMDLTALEWLEMMWSASYMLKSPTDKTTFKDVMDRVGLDYGK